MALKGWMKDLQQYIDGGGKVRSDPDDAHVGRCGAVVARSNKSQVDFSQWCHRGAGWNTDHLGIGYCHHHEDQLGNQEALPPWVGDIDPELWKEISGGRSPEELDVSNSLVYRVEKRWEDFLRESLTSEEWHVYQTMPTDPVTVLDTEIKLNRLQAMRYQREIKRLNMAADMDPHSIGGGSISREIKQAQAALIHISTVLARLMEVRARLSELASSDEKGQWLEETFRSMSHEEFSKLAANPHTLLTSFRPRGISA